MEAADKGFKGVSVLRDLRDLGAPQLDVSALVDLDSFDADLLDVQALDPDLEHFDYDMSLDDSQASARCSDPPSLSTAKSR